MTNFFLLSLSVTYTGGCAGFPGLSMDKFVRYGTTWYKDPEQQQVDFNAAQTNSCPGPNEFLAKVSNQEEYNFVKRTIREFRKLNI